MKEHDLKMKVRKAQSSFIALDAEVKRKEWFLNLLSKMTNETENELVRNYGLRNRRRDAKEILKIQEERLKDFLFNKEMGGF